MWHKGVRWRGGAPAEGGEHRKTGVLDLSLAEPRQLLWGVSDLERVEVDVASERAITNHHGLDLGQRRRRRGLGLGDGLLHAHGRTRLWEHRDRGEREGSDVERERHECLC